MKKVEYRFTGIKNSDLKGTNAMKKQLFTLFASIACASLYAAPGFLKAVFSGSAYNGTSDIWSYTKAEVVENMDDMYEVRSDVPETTTYAYGTYMELEGGVEYYFAGTFDDYVSVKVDDVTVIPQGGNCGTVAHGVIKFAETGWHKFDFRVANNGGPGGNTGNWTYGGIRMMRAQDGYSKIENNSEGTKCVTDAPAGYVAAKPEYAFSFNICADSSKTYIQLLKCGACNSNLCFPDKIRGYDILTIGDSCFNGNTILQSISHWPSKLSTIGGSSFYGCTSLNVVEIPDTVTSIGGSVFRCCTGLVSAKLPTGLVGTVDAMFMDCTSLTTVTMPSAPTKIESHTFRNCNALTEITIPDTVTYIGAYAFYDCRLLPEFSLSENVNSIGSYAFYNCQQFANIVIPDAVQSLGDNAFRECVNLKTVVLTENITSIPDGLFYNCKKLQPMEIPASVTSIGNQAFYGCESFVSFEIPNTVTSLGSGLFTNCTKLESLVLPDNLTSIPQSLVQYCTSFKSINIPVGVTTIGNMAFESTAIEEINLPDGLTHIGYHAFCNCKNLKSITIPASVTSFDNCSNRYPVFNSCSSTLQIIFMGPPPSNVAGSSAFNYNITYPREYGAQWLALSGINSFRGYNAAGVRYVKLVSSKIRENDPTIMDVVYKVTSTKATVKVRALAFEDGERSFAKVIRPETFIEGTQANIGDGITPNVEHTLSWRVSSDYTNRLAKIKFEVLAMEDQLVPLELMTIPASDSYGKMKVTWNSVTSSQWLDALYWLYADKDSGIVVENGIVKRSTDKYFMTFDGTSISTIIGYSRQYVNGVRAYYYFASVPEYVLSKMGYTIADSTILTYINEETRLGLSADGARQYGYKIVEE